MSQKNIDLLWKIPIRLDSSDIVKYSKLFNEPDTPNKTFWNKIGGVNTEKFSSTINELAIKKLDLTKYFYYKIKDIKNTLRDENKERQNAKFPFLFFSEYTRLEHSCNMTLMFFNPSILILTIKLASFQIEFEDNQTNFLNLQNIKNHGKLYDFTLELLNLIFPNKKQTRTTFKVYPCMLVQRNDKFEWLKDSLSVQGVTRHKNPTQIIIDEVIKKNDVHQLSSDNKIFLDRQGIFGINNTEEDLNSFQNKFDSLHCLFELGIAISELSNCTKNFPKGLIASILRLIYDYKTFFSKSTTVRESWELISREFMLKDLYLIPTATRREKADEEASYLILRFKEVLENKDGYKIFYRQGVLVDFDEAALQAAFKLFYDGRSEFDINSEVNNGRGSVDFKISSNSSNCAIIEFKLASNAQLKQNLQNQTKIYQVANGLTKCFKVILITTDTEDSKVQKILDEKPFKGDENIYTIDIRKKISASKVK